MFLLTPLFFPKKNVDVFLQIIWRILKNLYEMCQKFPI